MTREARKYTFTLCPIFQGRGASAVSAGQRNEEGMRVSSWCEVLRRAGNMFKIYQNDTIEAVRVVVRGDLTEIGKVVDGFPISRFRKLPPFSSESYLLEPETKVIELKLYVQKEVLNAESHVCGYIHLVRRPLLLPSGSPWEAVLDRLETLRNDMESIGVPFDRIIVHTTTPPEILKRDIPDFPDNLFARLSSYFQYVYCPEAKETH